MPSLMSNDGPPAQRCKICGAEAAGPCARCRSMVCADCCELTEGAATTFALCSACAKSGTATLSSGWRGLLGWLALIMLGLAAVGAVVYVLRHRS